jgi:dTDP-4-dehydrorhamnose reductase
MRCEILAFGGTGRLGTALVKTNPNIRTPQHCECDITNRGQVSHTLESLKPKVVINSAALVGTKECEKNRELAWLVNTQGATNVARICEEKGIRHVFISSAAIFDGRKGRYRESDPPTPTFYYAVTKVAAEQAVRMTNNFVIVRLDFFKVGSLKYKQIYTDHFTSKITAEEAAMKILKIARSAYVGIINIGQERKSLYEILKPFHPEIEPTTIAESSLPNFPRDISLNLDLWNEKFGQ